MKRDLDLVRQILVKAEGMEETTLRRSSRFLVEGYEQATVAKHLRLMEEAGLIEANLLELPESEGAVYGTVERITWHGYDFLELARDDSVWRRAREAVLTQGGALTLGILMEFLKAYAKAKLRIPGAGTEG